MTSATGDTYPGGLARPHPDAVGLAVFRVLPDGSGRQYTAVEFERGWNGVEHFVRTLRAFGYIRQSSTDTSGYAVLDVLNACGEIVQDYDLPTREAFAYVYRRLGLRVEPATRP